MRVAFPEMLPSIVLFVLLSSIFASANYDASKIINNDYYSHSSFDHVKALTKQQDSYMKDYPAVESYFRDYAVTGYHIMSKVLLESTGTKIGNDTDPYSCKTTDEYLEKVKKMNAAMLNMPKLTEPLVVYRTLQFLGKKKTALNAKYQQLGAIVPVTHLTSTTLCAAFGSPEYLLKITLPKGFPARILISQSPFKSEKEVLLPFTLDQNGQVANYGFKVMAIDKTPKKVMFGGQIQKHQKFIHLEVVNLETPITVDPSKIKCHKYSYDYSYNSYNDSVYNGSRIGMICAIVFVVLLLLVILIIVIRCRRKQRKIASLKSPQMDTVQLPPAYTA